MGAEGVASESHVPMLTWTRDGAIVAMESWWHWQRGEGRVHEHWAASKAPPAPLYSFPKDQIRLFLAVTVRLILAELYAPFCKQTPNFKVLKLAAMLNLTIILKLPKLG